MAQPDHTKQLIEVLHTIVKQHRSKKKNATRRAVQPPARSRGAVPYTG